MGQKFINILDRLLDHGDKIIFGLAIGFAVCILIMLLFPSARHSSNEYCNAAGKCITPYPDLYCRNYTCITAIPPER